MDARWIITGANGYVGGELCRGLIKLGEQVLGVARKGKSLYAVKEKGIPCCSYDELPSILSKGDYFIHCAGKVGNAGSWDEFVKINKDWTLSLYEQAKNSKADCFVYVSSIAALGYKNRPRDKVLDESSEPELVAGELYGRSKWLAEQAIQNAAGIAPTRLIILRPGLIYGHRPVPTNQTWLKRGIIVDPKQRVPLVHIDNFLDAIVCTVKKPEISGVFFVVDEEQPTLHELNTMKIKQGLLHYHPWKIGKIGFWFYILGRNIYSRFRRNKVRACKKYAMAEFYFCTRRLLYSTNKLQTKTGWKQKAGLPDGLKMIPTTQSKQDEVMVENRCTIL